MVDTEETNSSNVKLQTLQFPSRKNINFNRTQVVGIINIAPDSFSQVGRIHDPKKALDYAHQLVTEGATMLDIGAEPTNPQLSPNVSLELELERIIPVIELLGKELAVPISVDTSKPEVMRRVVNLGVDMINDVRALREPKALETIAELKVPVVLMHMSYPYGNVEAHEDPLGNDAIATINHFFEERIAACLQAGIANNQLILDPGIGAGNFGKSTNQSLQILNRLPDFKKFGLPLYVGASRKTFIGDVLGLPAEERLFGSLAAAVIAYQKGAQFIRVHDVKATVEALKIAKGIICEKKDVA